MNRFDYLKPKTLEEALAILAVTPGAVLVGGGTDVMVKIKNRAIAPKVLVSLRNIPTLAGIEVSAGRARIGAMTTISDIVKNAELARHFPVLAEAGRRLGSVQIRNAATIGGNLCNCSPCADTAPPLLALDARVRLAGETGSREVKISELFKGPGLSCLEKTEILTDILLDAQPEGARAVFLKKGRVRMDLSVVSLAALLDMDGKNIRKVRLAAGSVAPLPLRLEKAEALIATSGLSDETLDKASVLAMESIAPITDIRSTADYRREVTGAFVKRALRSLAGGEAL